MDLLLLTGPEFYPGEAEELAGLLELTGFELLVRKPEAEEADLAALLKALGPRHKGRIWLRGPPILTLEYGLAGHHFAEAERVQATCWRRRLKMVGSKLSTASHWADELDHLDGYDRVLFSPVFDSISKPGHRPKHRPEALAPAVERSKAQVFGLGGIEPGRLGQLAQWGFSGAALMGAVWQAERREERLLSLIEEAKAL